MASYDPENNISNLSQEAQEQEDKEGYVDLTKTNLDDINNLKANESNPYKQTQQILMADKD